MTDLNELEQNLLTSFAHVITTNLFAVSKHTIATKKLHVCPPAHILCM